MKTTKKELEKWFVSFLTNPKDRPYKQYDYMIINNEKIYLFNLIMKNGRLISLFALASDFSKAIKTLANDFSHYKYTAKDIKSVCTIIIPSAQTLLEHKDGVYLNGEKLDK